MVDPAKRHSGTTSRFDRSRKRGGGGDRERERERRRKAGSRRKQGREWRAGLGLDRLGEEGEGEREGERKGERKGKGGGRREKQNNAILANKGWGGCEGKGKKAFREVHGVSSLSLVKSNLKGSTSRSWTRNAWSVLDSRSLS
eukprot:312037-Rhodomonas_salina.1